MAVKTICFDLGTAGDLNDLFQWSPTVEQTPNDFGVLSDAIEHAFNQTLLRDLMYGSWASVYPDDGDWNVDQIVSMRITSPSANVSAYAEIIPNFLKAMATGLKIYDNKKVQDTLAATKKKLLKENPGVDPSDLNAFFLPPFGLAMQASDGVQLLHYPPAETLTYMDYLYSPTNRRWENLLYWSDWPGAKNTLLETITDIGPIAADGGSLGGDLIEPVLDDFQPYAIEMLSAVLRTSQSGKTTAPIVAYGGPVGQWLAKYFPDQIKEQGVKVDSYGDLEVCQAFHLHLSGPKGPKTPVMSANHPISFNYYDSDYLTAVQGEGDQTVAEVDYDYFITLQQDLVAAGWQAEMCASWEDDPDPAAVLSQMTSKWMKRSSPDFPKIYEIFREQVIEFMLENVPAFETKKWMAELVKATKDVSDGV